VPFRSKAQMRFMHAAEAAGEIAQGTADRWADETPNIKQLPEKVKKKKTAGLQRYKRVNLALMKKQKGKAPEEAATDLTESMLHDPEGLGAALRRAQGKFSDRVLKYQEKGKGSYEEAAKKQLSELEEAQKKTWMKHVATGEKKAFHILGLTMNKTALGKPWEERTTSEKWIGTPGEVGGATVGGLGGLAAGKGYQGGITLEQALAKNIGAGRYGLMRGAPGIGAGLGIIGGVLTAQQLEDMYKNQKEGSIRMNKQAQGYDDQYGTQGSQQLTPEQLMYLMYIMNQQQEQQQPQLQELPPEAMAGGGQPEGMPPEMMAGGAGGQPEGMPPRLSEVSQPEEQPQSLRPQLKAMESGMEGVGGGSSQMSPNVLPKTAEKQDVDGIKEGPQRSLLRGLLAPGKRRTGTRKGKPYVVESTMFSGRKVTPTRRGKPIVEPEKEASFKETCRVLGNNEALERIGL